MVIKFLQMNIFFNFINYGNDKLYKTIQLLDRFSKVNFNEPQWILQHRKEFV